MSATAATTTQDIECTTKRLTKKQKRSDQKADKSKIIMRI